MIWKPRLVFKAKFLRFFEQFFGGHLLKTSEIDFGLVTFL